MGRRSVLWLGSARADLRAFPAAARRRVGHALDLVQQGLEPSDWKPIPAVGNGVREIRIHAGGAYRVFYVAKFADGIVVIHAFQKKSQRTASMDIDVGRRRYREFLRQRGQD